MENGDRNSVSPLEIVTTPELELASRQSSQKNHGSRPLPQSRPVTDKKSGAVVDDGHTGDPSAVRLLILTEVVIIVCFLIFVRYSDDVLKGNDSQKSGGGDGSAAGPSELTHYPRKI